MKEPEQPLNQELKSLEEKFQCKLYDLNQKYPVPVGEICDRLGVEVTFDKSMTNECSGKIEFMNNKYIITINDNKNYYHNVFTIAHELGHYCKHQEIIKTVGIVERKWTEYNQDEIKRESEANRFAAELLMPREKFFEVFFDSNGDLTLVQQFFDVSLDAVKYRASNLGLILLV